MSKHSYKLVYLSKGGRAEPIRAIFHYLGQPFDDYIATSEEWQDLKPVSPTGGAPFLEVDGGKLVLGQTMAICRYLAKAIDPESYFGGSTKPEAALCDMYADCFSDLFNAAAYVKYLPGEANEILRGLFSKTCNTVFSTAEARLKTTGKYLAGKKLLWCDIYAAAVLMLVEDFVGELFLEPVQKFQNVVEFYHKIRESPKLKEYVQEHWPATEVKLD